jgi:hypothetical protein
MIVSNDQGIHIYQVNPDTNADLAGLVKSLDAITSQKAQNKDIMVILFDRRDEAQEVRASDNLDGSNPASNKGR